MERNWDDLRIFLAASRTGSFTAAAKALRIDQSTVSRRIAALEESIGAPLFVRHREGLFQTSAAETLTLHATSIEAEVVAALRVRQEDDLSGVVNVATTEAFAATLLQSGLGSLAKKYPGLCINLITSNRVVELLRGDADLALRLVRPREASLSIRKLGDLVFALYGAPQYLAQRGAPTDPSQLAGHDIVGMSGELCASPASKWLDSLAGIRIPMRTNSIPALGMAVAMGVGLGVLPTSWRQPGHQLERLCLINDLTPQPIWLVSHPAKKSAAVNLVAEMIGRLVLQLTSIS